MMDYGTFGDQKWIDGVILRQRARKRWRCWGSGARTAQHTAGCSGWIEPGEAYVEYIAETPSYQSGSRHSMLCAEAFFTRQPKPGSA